MATTQTKVTKPPARYSYKQLEDIWVKNSGAGLAYLAPIMAAIALAESGGNPQATHRNSDGSTDRGLWQINSVHGYGSSSLDPTQNAKQAVGVYHSQGLTAWTTFTNGAYLKYLPYTPAQKTKLGNALKKNPKPPQAGHGGRSFLGDLGHDVVSGNVTAVAGDVTGIHSNPVSGAVSGIEDVVMLGLKEGMYALAILGGGMLILLGLLFVGVDIGLSGLSNRATKHPAVRIVNAGSRRVSRGGGGMSEATGSEGTGDLPGPEA